jgi:hypothetical protein
MKHITKKITKLCSFALLALAFFTVSCEIPESPEDIIELRLDTNIFTHKGFIAVSDLADQDNLNGTALKAKVTVEGGAERPNILVSEGGNFGDVWNINDGFAAFAINPKYAGFSEPIVFSLEIYGDNYLSKTIDLTINPADFITEISETVLNTTKAPEGVVVKEQTETLTGGSNTEPIEVATEASTSGTSAAFSVPAATVFKDDTGTPITSGNLTAQIVYFDGNDEAAVRSSANSNVKSLVDENGNTLNNVVLSPAASVDVKMFLGSTAVRQFDEPIEISIDINENLLNPNTGVSVVAGDELNIYSTNDNSNWSFQSKGTITNVEGKLVVKFFTDHLTLFTVGFVVGVCSSDASVLIDLPNGGDGFASVYQGYFLDAETQAKTYTVALKVGAKLKLFKAPSSRSSLVLKPFVSGSSNIVVTQREWCGGPGGVVEVAAAELQGLAITTGVTVKITASVVCGSGSAIFPDKVTVFIDYNGDGNYTKVGVTDKGVISISGVTLNTEYSLKASFNGNSGVGPYTFETTDIEILDFPVPGDLCDEIGL